MSPLFGRNSNPVLMLNDAQVDSNSKSASTEDMKSIHNDRQLSERQDPIEANSSQFSFDASAL
jgi:hypothetical protein